MKRLWFRRKLYGWGWQPVGWEGWSVVGGFVVLVLGWSWWNDVENTGRIGMYLVGVWSLSLVLLGICLMKGERPRWQWGKRIED